MGPRDLLAHGGIRCGGHHEAFGFVARRQFPEIGRTQHVLFRRASFYRRLLGEHTASALRCARRVYQVVAIGCAADWAFHSRQAIL